MNNFNFKPARFNFFWLLLVLCFSLVLHACEKHANKEYKRTILAFGTLIEITLFNTDEQTANKAFEQLEKDYQYYHEAWSPWLPGALSTVNTKIQTQARFDISPEVTPLIQFSKQLFDSSYGLFNPAIGNLINLWAMHKHDQPGIMPPDNKQIAELVAQQAKMSDVEIDGTRLTSRNPNVQFNFGAYAKGYAIDLSMDYLKSVGIESAVINAGGDLRVMGYHGKRPWRIGINHPRTQGVIAWLDADANDSIFTSGDYERYYMFRGRRYHHILDPRTGYPARGTSSVTVIHDNAGVADAAATALFVAGPERWHGIARSMGIRYVMLITTDGSIHMNPAMAKRIHLTNSESSARSGHIVLSEPL